MIRFRWPRLKELKILCAGVIVLFGAAIYFISDDSRIRSLSVNGNYYYTAQQVYKIADLSTSSRFLLNPSFLIESRLEEDPMIEDASVHIHGQSVSIDIKEKLIVGYYLKDGQNYVLFADGQSLPIEDPTLMKNLIHVPLLADLSEETMQKICKQFQDYPEYLNRESLEKVAEILPWSESYDENMLKMIMQDGNVVFTSFSSLQMISNYQLVLTELVGEDVCLVLDSENGAIDKIACDYFNMSAEERDAYRQAIRLEAEAALREAQKAQEQDNQNQDNQESANLQEDAENENDEQSPEANENQDPDQNSEQNAQEAPEPGSDADLIERSKQAADWQPSESWNWLVYSPSVNTFKSVNDDIYYVYDESTASFRQLQ